MLVKAAPLRNMTSEKQTMSRLLCMKRMAISCLLASSYYGISPCHLLKIHILLSKNDSHAIYHYKEYCECVGSNNFCYQKRYFTCFLIFYLAVWYNVLCLTMDHSVTHSFTCSIVRSVYTMRRLRNIRMVDSVTTFTTLVPNEISFPVCDTLWQFPCLLD